MEEFLPTNRTVQVLDPESLRDGVLGALHQFQQQQQQGRRVADIVTWTHCWPSLYVAVMAKRRAELVPPMIAHLYT